MNREKKLAPSSSSNSGGNSSGTSMANARKYLRFLNVFGIFNKENLVNVMPYIFFLTVIALIYIANSYHAERTIREIDKTNKELKAMRTEYISGKSELMFVSKQSEVARLVGTQGIKESVEAPMKIMVKSEKSKK